MSRKNRYLRLCQEQPTDWLLTCAEHPTPFMSRTHQAICLIAIRRRMRGGRRS